MSNRGLNLRHGYIRIDAYSQLQSDLNKIQSLYNINTILTFNTEEKKIDADMRTQLVDAADVTKILIEYRF